MNVVLVVSDTVRRDRIGAYGCRWMRTPNLDALAAKSFVFEDAYLASFPTVPNRKDLHTGRACFTYDAWAPLGRQEVILCECLNRRGYLTQMINDTPHISRHGYYFDRGFAGWIWIRGQENDNWRTDPASPKFPCDPSKVRGGAQGALRQHLRNSSWWKGEQDHFCAQTFRQAADWLSRNHRTEPFLLYIDTFDPHEPWDPPAGYVEPYDPGYKGQQVTYPRYDFVDYLTKAELKHAHALYCGELSLVDRWFGHLLGRIEDLGLADRTAIIFVTDHGFLHGEHGMIGKALVRKGLSWCPLWDEIARIPLIIHLPGQYRAKRLSGYVQPIDLMPTILELAGAEIPDTCHGRSLVPMMQGKAASPRRIAVSTPCFRAAGRGIAAIHSGPWTLMYAPPGSHEGVVHDIDSQAREATLLKRLYDGPALYNREVDPAQTRNVIAEHRDVAERLHREFLEQLKAFGTADKYLAEREKLA